MKLSKNFYLYEFTNTEPKNIYPIQMMMLHNLCNNLQLMRDFICDRFCRDVKWTITSGIRLTSDNNRLRNAGYTPSETTDHFFGQVTKLRDKKKIKQFGQFYTFSVGAADAIPGCGAKEAFELMKPYFDRKTGIINLPNAHDGQLRIGQFILEHRNSWWLHVGNHPELIYSKEMVSTFLNRKYPFMISANNGIGYEAVF